MGHDHGLSVPISIGPVVLRTAFLILALAVVAYALLWPLVRTEGTSKLIARMAAASVVLELMLAGGFGFPAQIAVLLLALLVLSVTLGKKLGRAAPWVLATLGAVALVQFAYGWLSTGMVALHTGTAFALVGLAWLPAYQPQRMATMAVTYVQATVLGTALIPAIAHATVTSSLPG